MAEDSPAFERLAEAENAMVRAKELTQQLLTFSKGGAPVKETADITGIITDSTRFMLRGSQSRCEFAIDPALWTVDVDVGQISQVINNIVINADHAMPGGGTIHVSATNCTIQKGTPLPLTPGRYVKITIADKGAGYPRGKPGQDLRSVFHHQGKRERSWPFDRPLHHPETQRPYRDRVRTW